MFLKQTAFKPRSNSQSSGTNESAVDTSKSATAADNTAAAAAAQGRRRSSATEKFAGLSAYKRGSQEGIADKKANFADQSTAGSGVLGQMWTSFTKGT